MLCLRSGIVAAFKTTVEEHIGGSTTSGNVRQMPESDVKYQQRNKERLLRSLSVQVEPHACPGYGDIGGFAAKTQNQPHAECAGRVT
jgi:hypothetical protein